MKYVVTNSRIASSRAEPDATFPRSRDGTAMLPSLSRRREDTIDRAEQRRKTYVDEIHAGDAKRQIAVRDHSFVEKPIEEIQDGGFPGVEQLIGNRIASRHTQS
jgi:hypothetical protein